MQRRSLTVPSWYHAAPAALIHFSLAAGPARALMPRMIDSSVESPPGQDRERELLGRCRAGDPSALDALLRENLPALWRYSLGMTADRALAEDLAQETVARFITGLAAFEGRCRLSTYLYSIAHSVFLTQKRRDARKE